MSVDDLLKMYGGTAPCTSSPSDTETSASKDDGDDDGSSGMYEIFLKSLKFFLYIN